MQRLILAFATLAAAVGLSHQAQAQCACPKGSVAVCASASGGWVWVAPRGTTTHKSMPVPVETMLAGMTYVLKPDAEKQAYLQTLSGQDRQLIMDNISTFRTSVQSLRADNMKYQQEIRTSGLMTR